MDCGGQRAPRHHAQRERSPPSGSSANHRHRVGGVRRAQPGGEARSRGGLPRPGAPSIAPPGDGVAAALVMAGDSPSSDLELVDLRDLKGLAIKLGYPLAVMLLMIDMYSAERVLVLENAVSKAGFFHYGA